MRETALTSFIIRIVEETDDTSPIWRGQIRHVQSNKEVRFTQLSEMLQFMSKHVDLGDWHLDVNPTKNV